MSEPHVYTATHELATAWGENEQERTAFIRRVVEPWDAAHPDAKIAWVADPGGADRQAIGFLISKGEIPAGLSKSQRRRWLLPARGAAGDPYRDALKRMGDLPTRTAVFRRFDVPVRVIGGDRGDGLTHWCMTVAARLDGTLYVVNHGGPLSSPHLVTVPLSAFYAAKERQTEIEALAAGTRAASR